jgi:hypothetical protein
METVEVVWPGPLMPNAAQNLSAFQILGTRTQSYRSRKVMRPLVRS